ncbi:MAG TPA: membrane protein insertase YidC, partial [Holophaga sp.]|nr:membrane protein insertase YidC [Holophaga sp.]
PAPAAAPAAAPATAPATPAGTVDAAARFTLSTPKLKLTWRNQDGALVQAAWADGTPFFNEARREKDGKEISQDFPGLGAALEARFQGEPTVTEEPGFKVVTFASAEGDRLVYRVPVQGHVLDVAWTSPRAMTLNLMPMPAGESAVHGLGRVFTLEPKAIHDVSWTDMLKDPFFSFLGAKRKVLPPASSRVGMDAGIDHAAKGQRSWYFAAIWDASAVTLRDPAKGYLLAAPAGAGASARLYLGPKQAEELSAFHLPGRKDDGKVFTQVMDFGFFGLVAKLLFMILRGIHQVVPNWGWSIILLTVLIRGVLWPLNTKTTVQMLRMKELEPHQKALQAKYEKFGNDMAKKAEMQKELMAFYKKNGHNPMGGCLPMLLQMPVFFALWSMLNAVFELRHAPFAFWLKDLSAQDPFYVLPILMGVSMIVQQAMTPSVGDPTQRKMMMIMMPVMFTFFFASTPSGLCLYYLMFNLIGILQTWLVMRTYKPQPIVA